MSKTEEQLQIPLDGVTSQPRRFERLRKKRYAALSLGILALGGGIPVANHFMNKSGLVLSHEPPVALTTNPANTLRVGSFNTQDKAYVKAKDIAHFATRNQLSVIGLQEVSRANAEKLAKSKYLSTWYQKFVLADPLEHPLEGGYGNMLLSRRKMTDIKTYKIPGTTTGQSLAMGFKGLQQDIFKGNKSLDSTKNGWQEARALMFGTIKQPYKNGEVDVRVGVGHIAGSRYPTVHQEQFVTALLDTRKELEEGRPLVMMLDTNAGFKETSYGFDQLGMRTIGPLGVTGLTHSNEIDHIVYSETGITGNPTGAVDHMLQSDHSAISAEFPFMPPTPFAPQLDK